MAAWSVAACTAVGDGRGRRRRRPPAAGPSVRQEPFISGANRTSASGVERSVQGRPARRGKPVGVGGGQLARGGRCGSTWTTSDRALGRRPAAANSPQLVDALTGQRVVDRLGVQRRRRRRAGRRTPAGRSSLMSRPGPNHGRPGLGGRGRRSSRVGGRDRGQPQHEEEQQGRRARRHGAPVARHRRGTTVSWRSRRAPEPPVVAAVDPLVGQLVDRRDRQREPAPGLGVLARHGDVARGRARWAARCRRTRRPPRRRSRRQHDAEAACPPAASPGPPRRASKACSTMLPRISIDRHLEPDRGPRRTPSSIAGPQLLEPRHGRGRGSAGRPAPRAPGARAGRRQSAGPATASGIEGALRRSSRGTQHLVEVGQREDRHDRRGGPGDPQVAARPGARS